MNRLDDLASFLCSPERIVEAQKRRGWDFSRMTVGQLLKAELELKRVEGLLFDRALTKFPDVSEDVNPRHFGWGAIAQTWEDEFIYGVGGFHRYFKLETGVYLDAGHTGSSAQVDRVVLVALWLEIPVCYIRWRQPVTSVALEMRIALAASKIPWVEPIPRGVWRAIRFGESRAQIEQELKKERFPIPEETLEAIEEFLTSPQVPW